MRKLLLPLFLIACSAEKPEPTIPDYLAEDSKADSPASPASIVDITVGEVQTASFTSRSQYRAFRFDGKKGQKLSFYVDGLKGLDTVAYLYRVSATTKKPYGKALVYNDDTKIEYSIGGNGTNPNQYSSSIIEFVLPETRSFALVASTYWGDTGKAEVVLKGSAPVDQQCSGLIGYPACPDDQYCALPDGLCGGADLPGYCKPRPQVCIELYKPVCGCDGHTYGNDCFRQGAGAQLDHEGPCAQSLDDVAREHVFGSADSQKIYDSESDAYSANLSGQWLAHDGETGDVAKYVSGVNDLWAERFTVNKLTQEITVTAEH